MTFSVLFLFMVHSFRYYSSSLRQQKISLFLCPFSVVCAYIANGAYAHFFEYIIVNQLTFAIMDTKWNILLFRIALLGPLCIIMEENLPQAYPETQWWLCSLGDIFFYMLTRIDLGRALFWFTHTTKCSFCCCTARTCNLCYLLSVPWNFLKTHSLCCVLQFNINLNNSRRRTANCFLSVLNNAFWLLFEWPLQSYQRNHCLANKNQARGHSK